MWQILFSEAQSDTQKLLQLQVATASAELTRERQGIMAQGEFRKWRLLRPRNGYFKAKSGQETVPRFRAALMPEFH